MRRRTIFQNIKDSKFIIIVMSIIISTVCYLDTNNLLYTFMFFFITALLFSIMSRLDYVNRRYDRLNEIRYLRKNKIYRRQ